jgi:hypothetical protein
MERIILSLASGKVPEGVVDTAKVKPGQALGGRPSERVGGFYAEFVDYAPGLAARLDEKLGQPGMNPESGLGFYHPWFGDFTARQWYWLLATHLGIHYRQAKDIARKLPGLESAGKS